MSEIENARERLEKIETEAGCAKVGTGRAASLWYRHSRWLCNQLSGFLNGETETTELRRKLEESERARHHAELNLVAPQVADDLRRYKEKCDALAAELRNAITLCETMTTKFAEVKEQAVAVERERCAKIAEARVDEWDNIPEQLVAQDIAAAIRGEEGAPDGK